MSNETPNQSTAKPARDVIADALMIVCSDGNSDSRKVAEDVIMALGIAGYEIVPVGEYQ